MSRLRVALSRFVGLFYQRRRDRDLDAEFDAHLQLEIDDLVRRGASPGEARRQALIRAGGIESAKDASRDQRGVPAIEALGRACRHAAAGLRRSPGYAITVLTSFALGVGANTAMFSFADTVLRRPLPYHDASSLVTAGTTNPSGVSWDVFGPDVTAWSQGARTLAAMTFVGKYSGVVVGDGEPEVVHAGFASPNLLGLLGTSPLKGRWFQDGDVEPSAERVVVIGHGLWRRQFGGRDDAIGKTLRIYGTPTTVIGVLRPMQLLPLQAEFWLPQRGAQGQLVARPYEGASLDAIKAELTGLAPSIANRRQRGRAAEVVVMPLQEQLFGPVAPVARLLFGATLLLLLMACANAANLSLARAVDRGREWSVRAALGASRASLVLLLLAENALLIGAGGLGGVVVAFVAGRSLATIAPADVTLPNGIGVDITAIAFSLGIVVVSILVASAGPAIAILRRHPAPSLSLQTTRHSHAPAAIWSRRMIATAQLAIALLLLVGAALVAKSVRQLAAVDLGFDPRGLAMASINMTGPQYRDPDVFRRFHESVRTRLANAPGVDAVTFGPVPLVAGRHTLQEGFNMIFTGPRPAAADRAPTVWVKYVDAGYVDMFRVRVSAGRAFTPADNAVAPAVAMMNRRAASLFFPDGIAVGRPLTGAPSSLSGGRAMTVIGVVDDVRQRDVTLAAEPEIFLPLAQQSGSMSETTVTVRTRGEATAVLPTLRRVLKEVDPALATTRLMTMDAVVAQSLSRYAFLLTLFGIFSTIALTLAMVGLFAVISYAVTHRTREIGIRMALGATQGSVLGLVGIEIGRLVGLGAIVGLTAAFGLSGTLASLLFEIAPVEPETFVAGVVIVCAAATVAALIPARRAIAIDPTVTLKAE